MKLKAYLTILTLLLFHVGFSQNFKPEKLIGKWECKQGKDIQIYTFVDASHLLIYNNLNTDGSPNTVPRRYRLEKITSSGFRLIISEEGDTDPTHVSKDKCTWLSDKQFKTEPDGIIIDADQFKFLFTKKK